ncbi:MAG: RHS repeat-associated core domain-containing protein [Chloroflexi bacterium]|nr:RHS repeat-associated core domain-containing protein [Chloroflexota bacterium]
MPDLPWCQAEMDPNEDLRGALLRSIPERSGVDTAGITPTSFNPSTALRTGFTGQRKDSGSGLLFDNARWYDLQVGRFLQADTIVPAPGNPQSLNRYSYVGNRPLVYTDPSGYAPQDPYDADDNPAACATDWCWQNRWYRARGYTWHNGGWVLLGHDAKFYDMGILRDTMRELGILLTADPHTPWTLPQASLVAQGVVALANKIGSFGQLRSLLGFGVLPTFFHRAATPLWIIQNASAHTIPLTTLVIFTNNLFLGSDDFVRGTAVHELAHVIDHFGGVGGMAKPVNASGGLWQRGAMVPKDAYVSDYGVTNALGLEYWAEAVATWVYGSRYQSQLRGRTEPLTVSQTDWIGRVLKGWGW